MPGVNVFTTTTDLGELTGNSTTVLQPIKHRLKIFTDNLKLPIGIAPYAGAEGLSEIQPRVGAILWTHNNKSARLEAVRMIGPQGKLEQYVVWKFEWLTGPERSKIINDYDRQYWWPTPKQPEPEPEPE